MTIIVEELRRLIGVQKVKDNSFIVLIDDGSSDRTWQLIKEWSNNPYVQGLKLSRNFGHQNALLAGMLAYRKQYDAVVTLDVDLQDDINVIEPMLDLHKRGDKIVLGVRENRESDTFFKRNSAILFYRMMSLLGVSTVFNHADFRLMDQEAVLQLSKFRERNLFLRGIITQIGLPTSQVYYSRKKRSAGDTKYPLRKMTAFAFRGITSFSAFPLRLIFYIGLIVFFMSVALVIWALIQNFSGKTVPGWASIVIPVFVFSGIQMVCLGVIGEYIGNIYEEIKDRPRYIIEDKT